MVSKFSHNQPWKVQLRVLEDDQDDLKAILASKEMQLMELEWEPERAIIPFAISGKMLYKDMQATIFYTHLYFYIHIITVQ